MIAYVGKNLGDGIRVDRFGAGAEYTGRGFGEGMSVNLRRLK